MDQEAGLASQTELRPVPPCEFLPEASITRGSERRADFSAGELPFRMLVAFRVHPHLSNVLTHISGANWAKVEGSLKSILDPAATSGGLSPLAQNIIELMCADRGITGRIMKPYFHAVLHALLEPNRAAQLILHITTLFLELEWSEQQPTQSEPPGHVRSETQ